MYAWASPAKGPASNPLTGLMTDVSQSAAPPSGYNYYIFGPLGLNTSAKQNSNTNKTVTPCRRQWAYPGQPVQIASRSR